METVRLRLVFDDRHILSKPQRSEGLDRSWLLLKPPIETISDVSSYLLRIFDLCHSCPNGIILSMDGYVLPPFESASILKDRDVIRVERKGMKRKGANLPQVVEACNGENLIEEGEIVEKQPVMTGVPLLTNGESEKETGGYQSEPQEDQDNQLEDRLHVENSSARNVISKKRKASKKLQSPKKKKKRPVDPQNIEKEIHMEPKKSCGLHSVKSIDKKKKVSDSKNRRKTENTHERAEMNSTSFEPLPSPKRFGEMKEIGEESSLPLLPNRTAKVPSRSARRKKAKRLWLRELVKAEKEELHRIQSSEKDTHKNSTEHQQQNQNSKATSENVADDEIVPMVIRPGHIRFEPVEIEDPEQAVQQNQVSVETFQWNGITSKKKGQKWGTEKLPSRRNDYKDSKKECIVMTTTEKVTTPNDPIDFIKLPPCASFPKEGDVIAYRVLELSSTWTPELSSFRVGKTSWYDPGSNRILLTPVPEYPVTFEKPEEEESAEPPINSLYMDDGSLEIDFSLLVDVRIIKHGDLGPEEAASLGENGCQVGTEVAMSSAGPSNNDKQTHAPKPEKEGNVWDELSQALSDKKEELVRENGWSTETSGRSSWSYRAMRGSALGPAMAILRAKNAI